MKNHEFPFQQGDLDWLCSLYATINLMHLQKDIDGIEDAGIKFNELLQYVAKNGDLFRTITEGVYRADVIEFLSHFDYKAKRFVKPTPEEIVEHSTDGAIIYLKRPDGFDHYTAIRAVGGLGKIELFDSYGFKKIQCRDGAWFLDDGEIAILNLYTAKK